MPYGTARTAAAEEITRRIEAEGPRSQLPEALLDLVEAYIFTGQGTKSFVSLRPAAAAVGREPPSCSTTPTPTTCSGSSSGWRPTWPTTRRSAGSRPPPSWPTWDDATTWPGTAGRRWRCREFIWAWHSGTPDAEAARQRWLATPADEFQDCTACFTGLQVAYLTETGRFDEAIRLGEARQGSCNREPTGTLHSLALAYLNQGRAADAVRAHQAAIATLDLSTGDFASARGQAFELLARGGQLARALRNLREDYPQLLTHAATELARLRFLLSVLAGLSANLDQAGLAVELRQPDVATVGELHAWAHQQAAELAGRFDVRNGTDYYRRLLEHALAARPAAVALEFGLPSVDPAGGTDHADPTPLPPNRALEHAEQLAASGDHVAAAQAYAELAGRAEQAGELADAGLMLAEAGHCLDQVGAEEAAHDHFARSVSRLLAGGAEAGLISQVLTTWAPIAARLAQAAAVVAAVDELLARPAAPQPEQLSDELAARRHREQTGLAADLADVWARSVASLTAEQRSPGRELTDAVRTAQQAGEQYAAVGRIADAAHAFWLAGQLQRQTGDTEGAIWALESAVEGFSAAGQRKLRITVASELIELLRATGQDAKVEALLATLN
ncbi:MAG: hypothetical protein QM804_19220 [Propionicimonas sp.]